MALKCLCSINICFSHSQLRKPVPLTLVHSGHSLRVMVVAQEVDGLAVLPGDGTQTFPATDFVPATFGQPPAEFLGVMLAAWHDGARGQDSQFALTGDPEASRKSSLGPLLGGEILAHPRARCQTDIQGQQ